MKNGEKIFEMVRAALKNGWTCRAIARELNVSRELIWKVKEWMRQAGELPERN